MLTAVILLIAEFCLPEKLRIISVLADTGLVCTVRNKGRCFYFSCFDDACNFFIRDTPNSTATEAVARSDAVCT